MDLTDPWVSAYLGAFGIGLLTTVGMLILGGLHHGDGGHGGDGVHGGHADGASAVSFASHLGHVFAPLLNLSSLLALLMCGGAAGLIGLRLGGRVVSVLSAAAGGFAGSYAMVWVMRLFWRAEAGVVRPTDLAGTLARVIAPISRVHMGEIVFTRHDGSRQALPARSDGEEELGKDVQVVVVRVERGTAYVRRLTAAEEEEK